MMMPTDTTAFALTFLESVLVELERLAAIWLTSGALQFGVLIDGEPLYMWPMGMMAMPADCIVPLTLDIPFQVELTVSAPTIKMIRPRLSTDAALISRIVRQENELEKVVNDLVDNQDQLLALYDLVQSSRFQLKTDEIMIDIVDGLPQILPIKYAFAAYIEDQKVKYFAQKPDGKWPEKILLGLQRLLNEENEFLLPSPKADSPLPPGLYNLFLQKTVVRENGYLLLGVGNKPESALRTPEIKLARTIAAQGAGQIENSLLLLDKLHQTRMQAQMELAREVQSRLLPQRTPELPQLDCAMFAAPAWEVGGDFYDYILPGEKPFTFVLGDVSGKGMAAALFMAMTRVVVRSAVQRQESPACDGILAEVNKQLYDEFTDSSKFVTALVGQYDSDRQVIRYANAGHSPVIYCPADGEPVMLEADAPPLGVLNINLAEEHLCPLKPGDLFVIATDGFVEAENAAGEMLGYERFAAEIGANRHLPAASIMQALVAQVNDFIGDVPPGDDMTLMIIKGKR